MDDGIVWTLEKLNAVNRQFASRASLSSGTGLGSKVGRWILPRGWIWTSKMAGGNQTKTRCSRFLGSWRIFPLRDFSCWPPASHPCGLCLLRQRSSWPIFNLTDVAGCHWETEGCSVDPKGEPQKPAEEGTPAAFTRRHITVENPPSKFSSSFTALFRCVPLSPSKNSKSSIGRNGSNRTQVFWSVVQ